MTLSPSPDGAPLANTMENIMYMVRTCHEGWNGSQWAAWSCYCFDTLEEALAYRDEFVAGPWTTTPNVRIEVLKFDLPETLSSQVAETAT
jgi:hypothetical protein